MKKKKRKRQRGLKAVLASVEHRKWVRLQQPLVSVHCAAASGCVRVVKESECLHSKGGVREKRKQKVKTTKAETKRESVKEDTIGRKTVKDDTGTYYIMKASQYSPPSPRSRLFRFPSLSVRVSFTIQGSTHSLGDSLPPFHISKGKKKKKAIMLTVGCNTIVTRNAFLWMHGSGEDHRSQQ